MTQEVEIRGVLFKGEDGTIIQEVVGNGFKTKTKEVILDKNQVLIGFYGTINGVGLAMQSLGLITFNSK